MAAEKEGAGGAVGSNANSWRPLVTQIAAMHGIGNTVDAWLRQIQTESGGNPRIVQQVRDVNWPSNLAAGLLQVTPTTFRAYGNGGPFGPNILDPRANIWTAMNYAKQRYGSRLLQAIGRGRGYARGGVITEPVAGMGLRSGAPYSFAESGPELVTPLRRGGFADTPMSGRGDGGGVTVNVYPQPGQSPEEIAAAVARRLEWAQAGGQV
jgi:hypothetical protein